MRESPHPRCPVSRCTRPCADLGGALAGAGLGQMHALNDLDEPEIHNATVTAEAAEPLTSLWWDVSKVHRESGCRGSTVRGTCWTPATRTTATATATANQLMTDSTTGSRGSRAPRCTPWPHPHSASLPRSRCGPDCWRDLELSVPRASSGPERSAAERPGAHHAGWFEPRRALRGLDAAHSADRTAGLRRPRPTR